MTLALDSRREDEYTKRTGDVQMNEQITEREREETDRQTDRDRETETQRERERLGEEE